MYTKVFLLRLIKAWENIKKKKRTDGKIGEHKWNGSTEYEIERVKQT